MSNIIYEIKKDGYSNWVIADEGGWLPGSYDSREAAEYAFGFPYTTLYRLQEEINSKELDLNKRVITMDDLKNITS